MRRYRAPYQRTFFETPIYSHREISTHVGNFFEELVARIVGGRRVTVDQDPSSGNWHPDVEARDREIEVKAAGRERWFLRAEQLEHLPIVKGAEIALVRYQCLRGLHKRCRTVQQLHAEITAEPVHVWFLPGAIVGLLGATCKKMQLDRGSSVVHELKCDKVKSLFTSAQKPVGVTGVESIKVKSNVQVCGVSISKVHLHSGLKLQIPVDSVPF